ncbi:UPF0283 membrane protein [Dissostichus eleginoides]|uniref:UPF0283 membrane protein n=1 Tax=Dissostichus eleginoides TaxID=100907 RepID=A0AAD9EV71_DISEL|nr:UPF0283 membrane protein [Dissostichus eleginoides]
MAVSWLVCPGGRLLMRISLTVTAQLREEQGMKGGSLSSRNHSLAARAMGPTFNFKPRRSRSSHGPLGHAHRAWSSGVGVDSRAKVGGLLAINTESIIAPRGATGQGGRERHRLKGQRLKRKQEGQIMKEAQGLGQAPAEALRCTGLPAANPPCWPG